MRLFRGWGLIWLLPAEVKRVDARLVSTEARNYYGLKMEAAPYPWVIEHWGPETARERFLERSRELR